MATIQEKRTRLVEKMRRVRHWLLGALAVDPVPGTVFDPAAFFFDPGRLPTLLAYWRFRAGRAGVGSGLPPRLREAALDAAADACLTHFLDADYKRLEITADEFARAALYALRRCRLAFWSDSDGARDIDRARRADRHGGEWRLWNRAQASRTPDPRRIVHAADALGQDATAVDGRGMTDERPGRLVRIPGGPSGRGETDGKMRLVTVRDIVHNEFTAAGERLELQTTETRWRMIRGRGKARRLPACAVRDGSPAPRPVFRPAPMPGPMPSGKAGKPLPPVNAADAIHGMRRLGRAMPRGGEERLRIAANLRTARGR